MNMGRSTRVGALATLLLLAGCAGSPGSIYVPVGGGTGSTSEPPPPPRLPPASPEPEAPAPAQVPERAPSPSYRESGDTLSPAALSLVREADRLLAQGRVAEAITRLERAQRIAPPLGGSLLQTVRGLRPGQPAGPCRAIYPEGAVAGRQQYPAAEGRLVAAGGYPPGPGECCRRGSGGSEGGGPVGPETGRTRTRQTGPGAERPTAQGCRGMGAAMVSLPATTVTVWIPSNSRTSSVSLSSSWQL